MKTLITTLMLSLTLVAPQAFAGGSGGGGVLMDGMTFGTHEIVFHIEQKDGMVRFKYGQLFGSTWKIQNVEISESDLSSDEEALRALNASKASGQWVSVEVTPNGKMGSN